MGDNNVVFVNRATASALKEPDWTTNMQICEFCNSHTDQTGNIVKEIQHKLKEASTPEQTVLLSLILLDSLVKNVASARQYASTKDICKLLEKVAKCEQKAKGRKKRDSQLITQDSVDGGALTPVEEKAMKMMQAWGALHPKEFPYFLERLEKWKVAGVQFPPAEAEDLVPLAERTTKPAPSTVRVPVAAAAPQPSAGAYPPAVSYYAYQAQPGFVAGPVVVRRPPPPAGTTTVAAAAAAGSASGEIGLVSQAEECSQLLIELKGQQPCEMPDLVQSLTEQCKAMKPKLTAAIEQFVEKGVSEEILARFFAASEQVERALGPITTRPVAPVPTGATATPPQFIPMPAPVTTLPTPPPPSYVELLGTVAATQTYAPPPVQAQAPTYYPPPPPPAAPIVYQPPPAIAVQPAQPPPSSTAGRSVLLTSEDFFSSIDASRPRVTPPPPAAQPPQVSPQPSDISFFSTPMQPTPMYTPQPPYPPAPTSQAAPPPQQPGKRDAILDLLMSQARTTPAMQQPPFPTLQNRFLPAFPSPNNPNVTKLKKPRLRMGKQGSGLAFLLSVALNFLSCSATSPLLCVSTDQPLVLSLNHPHQPSTYLAPAKQPHSPTTDCCLRPATRSKPFTDQMTSWKLARIFISSTFKDFGSERDILNRRVFPELQERANKLRVRIIPVDLRWGVTEDQTSQALEICLNEIDGCRPFFLGMIGMRYGWTPDSYAGAIESSPLLAWLGTAKKGLSVTHMEMLHGCLNSSPGNPNALVCLRDPLFMSSLPGNVAPDFQPENEASRSGIEELVDQVRKAGTAGRISVLDGYSCHWKGMVDGKPTLGGLESFADRVLEHLWSVVQGQFQANGAEPVSPLDEARILHETFAESASRGFIGRGSDLYHLRCYCPPWEPVFDSVGPSPTDSPRPPMAVLRQPCVVFGETGVGKTALLSAFVRECQLRVKEEAPHFKLISHFIGSVPGSRDIRRIIQRLCSEIAHTLGLPDPVLPSDYAEQKGLLKDLCTKVSQWPGRMVIILDALDQLEETQNATNMEWLPQKIPDNISFLLTASAAGKPLEALRRRKALFVELEPLPVSERREVVRRLLREYRKVLEEKDGNDQMGLLVGKRDACKPLYLFVACEELRVFGIFEKVSEYIRSMPETLEGLFDFVLTRLEKDFGAVFVRNTLALLGCSKGGLYDGDILQLLGHGGEITTPLEGPLRSDLPRAEWAPFCVALKQYLAPRSAQDPLVLFNFTFTQAVHRRYLESTSSLKETIHRRLAEYFLLQADPHRSGKWDGEAKALGSLPRHLLLSKWWDQLHTVLSDLGYVESMCRNNLSYELLSDYLSVGKCKQLAAEHPTIYAEIEEFRSLLQSRVQTLTAKPHECFSLAINLPAGTSPQKMAQQRLKDGRERRAWLEWINKPKTRDPCNISYVGTELPYRSSAVNPVDPSMAACGGDDGVVQIFNTETGEETMSLRGHIGPVFCLEFSPDGKFVASGSNDKSVRIWNPLTGIEMFRCVGHKAAVVKVSWHPEGKMLASASADKTVRTWLSDGSKLGRCKLDASATGCSWSPDCRLLATATETGTLRFWSSQDWAAMGQIGAHKKPLRACRFSPDSALIATASDDRTIKVWNVETGSLVHCFQDAFDATLDVDWSPDGSKLAFASHDNVVRVKSLFGAPSGDQTSLFIGHAGSVFTCQFTRGGKELVSSSFDRSVKVWNIERAGQLSHSHLSRVLGVGFSPNGSHIVSASRDKTLKVWSIAKEEEVLSLQGHIGNVFSCSFSGTGDRILSSSRDHTLKVWDFPTGELLQTLDQAHSGDIFRCCWNPLESNMVCSVASDKLVKLWDLRTPAKPVSVFFGHKDTVLCCAWAPNGGKIVSGGEDYTLKLWDSRTNKKLATFSGHEKGFHRYEGQKRGVHSCCFSADSGIVLSGGDDCTLREWNTVNAKLLSTTKAHTETVTGTCFSRDGKRVFTTSTDGSIVQYTNDTKAVISSFSCISRLTCLASSPTEPLLCAGDGSGVVYFFRPKNI